jgi:protein involved in polysaccharide export with SLBB domain
MTLGIAACGMPAVRQTDWGVRRVDVAREDLQELSGRLDQASRSQAYSRELRERSRRETQALRERLSNGDFRVGDRIVLWVEGEEALTDTFVVTPERTVILPTVGEVDLSGLLRTELDARIRDEVGRYISNPILSTRSLVRISFIGFFAEEGFYLVPPEMPLSDALMTYPGLGPEGNVAKARIVRGDEILLQGRELRDALRDGATLGELRLYSGDQVNLPRRSAFAAGEIGRTIAVAGTIIWAFDRIIR